MNISQLAAAAAHTAKLPTGYVVVAGGGRESAHIRIDTLTLEEFISTPLKERTSDYDVHLPLLQDSPDLVGTCLVASSAEEERLFIASLIEARQVFGLQGMWLENPVITNPKFTNPRSINLGKGNVS